MTMQNEKLALKVEDVAPNGYALGRATVRQRKTGRPAVSASYRGMALILAPGDYTRWLGEEPDPRDLLRPFPAESMR
jgi:hypothetical protein